MKIRNWIVASLMASVALPVGQGALAQGLALEEIVVTARKRDENIYEIPISVSSMSQLQLDRTGISNPEDLSAFIPGLDFQGSTSTGSRQNPAIRFRGLNQQLITPSSQIGALFWDGSYVGGGGGFLPFTDLERVEVIKGPQTAYFGRNTFSGAVNIIPKLPGDEFEGYVAFDWSPSQADEFNIEGAMGGPITDKVGMRLYAGFDQDGGDFKTQVDEKAYAQTKDFSVSGTIVADPTDNLMLKLTGYLINASDTGTSGSVTSRLVDGVAAGQCGISYTGEYLNAVTGQRTPFTRNLSDFGGTTFCGKFPNGDNWVAPFELVPSQASTFTRSADRLSILDTIHPLHEKYGITPKPPGLFGGEQRSYRLQFSGEYDFADHTLSFVTSRANTGTSSAVDFFFGDPPLGGFLGTNFIVGTQIAIRETYYEARIASPQDGRLRYLVGVSDYAQRYRNSDPPTVSAPLQPLDWQDSSTFGIFASADYDITDDLTVSVEARYTDEETTTIIQGNIPAGWGGSGASCPVSTTCNAVNEYTDFIPRAILSYSPFDGATVYGSYAYSSLLGVPTRATFVNSVAPLVIPSDLLATLGNYTAVQEAEQLEIGWKQQSENWAFTLAVYNIDWKNQPFAAVIVIPAANGGGTTAYAGNGDSKYQGFDFEFTVSPVDWLSLSGTFAYQDNRLVTFSSRGSNESRVLNSGPLSVVNDGNRVRNTPTTTGSLSPTLFGQLGEREWFIRTDFLYEGATWADYSQLNRAPDRFEINMRAGLDLTDGLSVELWGKNLTDERTLNLNGGTTGFISLDRKAFSEPPQKREFGVRLRAEF